MYSVALNIYTGGPRSSNGFMAGASFKKVLIEPFIERMIIGHDNPWHAMCSQAVPPGTCVTTTCSALLDSRRILI